AAAAWPPTARQSARPSCGRPAASRTILAGAWPETPADETVLPPWPADAASGAAVDGCFPAPPRRTLPAFDCWSKAGRSVLHGPCDGLESSGVARHSCSSRFRCGAVLRRRPPAERLRRINAQAASSWTASAPEASGWVDDAAGCSTASSASPAFLGGARL